jgi:hypothetical protein
MAVKTGERDDDDTGVVPSNETYLVYFDTVDQRWMLAAQVGVGFALEPWIPAPPEIAAGRPETAQNWATAQLSALYGPDIAPDWHVHPGPPESPAFITHLGSDPETRRG